jgi:uncharacterized phage-associated protein
MFFRFDVQKAIQSVGVLLRFDQTRQIGRKRLLALLYIAERETMKDTGRPIIGGHSVAMKHGPIHSEVLDLINGKHSHEPEWFTQFQNYGFKVGLRGDPGVLGLSRYEIGKLNEVSERFSNTDDWDLAEQTHFDEYVKNYKEGTSKTIPIEDMLDSIGRADDKEAILRDAKEKSFFDHIFQGMIV